MLFHRQHEGQSHCFWSPFANVTVLVLSIMAKIKPIMKSWNYEIKPIMAEIKPITLCRNFCCLSQHHDVKCQHSTIVGTKCEKHFDFGLWQGIEWIFKCKEGHIQSKLRLQKSKLGITV